MIDIHGNSIQPDTIGALHLTKDTILQYSSVLDIPITKRLLRSVSLARQRYESDLEVKRKLKEAEEKAKELKTLNEKVSQEKALMEEEERRIVSAIEQVNDGFVVADELVCEGNQELKNCLLQKNSSRSALQRAQSKIETGMKRRAELSEQKDVLEK